MGRAQELKWLALSFFLYSPFKPVLKKASWILLKFAKFCKKRLRNMEKKICDFLRKFLFIGNPSLIVLIYFQTMLCWKKWIKKIWKKANTSPPNKAVPNSTQWPQTVAPIYTKGKVKLLVRLEDCNFNLMPKL